MSALDSKPEWRQRFGYLLLAALALAILHRFVAKLATEPWRAVAHGYSDGELLAAGGDTALQLLLERQDALLGALRQTGLWLLGGRVACFFAVFFLHVAAYSLAVAERSPPVPGSRLHLGWALPLAVATSLTGGGLLGALGWALAVLARALRQREGADWPPYVALCAAGLGLCWALCEVWLNLLELAFAGARLRPFAAAKGAGRAWLENWGRLLLGRLALSAVTIGAIAAGILLLPAVTRGSPGERAWATIAIDLGLLGAICLRGAWLTWASAHLPRDHSPALTPATFEDVAPSAIPDAQADPSPSPDA